MTRFAIDAPVAVRLARDEVSISDEHQLVGPSILRSHAMSLLYGGVRSGELDETEALLALDRLTTMRIRLLGDRVLQDVAWKVATKLGWPDTLDAEYVALTQLQADAFITLDPALADAVNGLVTIAPIEALWQTGRGS